VVGDLRQSAGKPGAVGRRAGTHRNMRFDGSPSERRKGRRKSLVVISGTLSLKRPQAPAEAVSAGNRPFSPTLNGRAIKVTIVLETAEIAMLSVPDGQRRTTLRLKVAGLNVSATSPPSRCAKRSPRLPKATRISAWQSCKASWNEETWFQRPGSQSNSRRRRRLVKRHLPMPANYPVRNLRHWPRQGAIIDLRSFSPCAVHHALITAAA
jgi:hypothetical protein